MIKVNILKIFAELPCGKSTLPGEFECSYFLLLNLIPVQNQIATGALGQGVFTVWNE